MILEVCVDSLSSLLTAKKAGANRIELCSSLKSGGLTPSYGLMRQASKIEGLEIFVMIRPRSGDFLYDEYEFETMKYDIELVKEMGFDGIVTGILKADGKIDIKRMRELVELASPLQVVIHRAFDRAKDPEPDINNLIEMGICRILTSGQQANALLGANYIRDIQEKHGDKITIMPGSGVNHLNVEEIYKVTKCTNFHLSGRLKLESKMSYRNGIDGENEYIIEKADFDLIKSIREVLDSL